MHHLKMAHTVPKDPDDHERVHVHDFSLEEIRCHFFSSMKFFKFKRGSTI